MLNNNKKRTRPIDAEGRIFQERWEVEYFFVEHCGASVCLICNENIAVMKAYNLKRHYETRHKGDFGKFEGKVREEKLASLKKNLIAQQNVFKKVSKQTEAAVKASYEVAVAIAKQGKPFTDGEFVKSCMMKVVGHICPEKQAQFSAVSLSKQIVTRRVEEIADNLHEQLATASKNFIWYSVALDESTDLSDTAQLLIFIRGVTENFEITEDLAGLCSIHNTTKGKDIFDELKKVLENFQLPWEKLSAITTDGAPAMCGEKNGVAGLVKVQCSGSSEQPWSYHCIIHQEALCSKSLKMHHVMSVVVKTVNFIRAHSTNHRMFKEFLEEVGAEFSDIPYHTEVRWLSRSIVLEKFYALRNEICTFMKEKNSPVPELEDMTWLQDLAFLSDMMMHLNQLNIKLQGSNRLVHVLYESVQAFETKLSIFIAHLQVRRLDHFPKCKDIITSEGNSSFEFDRYKELVESLLQEFNVRFKDFRSHDIAFRLFGSPYLVNVDDVPAHFQMELVQLQSDSFIKQKFLEGDITKFYCLLNSDTYPALRANAMRMMSLFGSTYICEQTFSRMKGSKSAHRTRLTDNHLHDVLRISVSPFEPKIDEMSADKQAQISH